MHGPVHDFVTLMTVYKGENKFSGEGWGCREIKYDSSVYSTIKPFIRKQPKFKKILSIGSLDINGNQFDYDFLGHPPKWLDIVGGEKVGIDLIAGRNVDIVMNSHDLKFDDNSFDLVLCLNMLEHDNQALKTLKETKRVLTRGGVFLLSCSNEKHGKHQDLGGGSEFYHGWTTKEMNSMLKKVFKSYKLWTIGGDHFIYVKN